MNNTNTNDTKLPTVTGNDENDGLFNDNPALVIKKATDIATLLTNIVTSRKLYTNIKGNKHVHVTGWSVMLSMLGIASKPIINEIIEAGGHITSKCYIELYSAKSGKIIGGGWGVCSSKEPSKRHDSCHCIQSMAQTRALGKAARLSFAWVVKLAGYDPTPAEEMLAIGEDSNSNEPQGGLAIAADTRKNLANSLRASVA